MLFGSQFNNEIKGEWILQKESLNVFDYPSIIFSDSNRCIMTSIGDTIYYGRFEMKESELIIITKNERYINAILYKDSAKIVFKSFLDVKEKVTYIKKD